MNIFLIFVIVNIFLILILEFSFHNFAQRIHAAVRNRLSTSVVEPCVWGTVIILYDFHFINLFFTKQK